MKTRTFQMELHAPTEDFRRFFVTEDGKQFAMGELPPDTTKEAARRVVYAMLSAYVGTEARVVVTHVNASAKRATWDAQWVRPDHVRIRVLDETQDPMGGFDVLLDTYRGCARDGMARHELHEILDGVLETIVESVAKVLARSGYEHDNAAAMKILHEAVTVPLLDREFPINTKEMN